jgi:hypothetical protein
VGRHADTGCNGYLASTLSELLRNPAGLIDEFEDRDPRNWHPSVPSPLIYL